jgi:hypothetical protein
MHYSRFYTGKGTKSAPFTPPDDMTMDYAEFCLAVVKHLEQKGQGFYPIHVLYNTQKGRVTVQIVNKDGDVHAHHASDAEGIGNYFLGVVGLRDIMSAELRQMMDDEIFVDI